MILAIALAMALATDDCDNSASARATCDASIAQLATEKRVAHAYEAALKAARHADHDPNWTRPDFTDNESYAKALMQSQRAWETSADKQCSFEELEERYGTQHGVLYNQCYEKLANDRVAWLLAAKERYQ